MGPGRKIERYENAMVRETGNHGYTGTCDQGVRGETMRLVRIWAVESGVGTVTAPAA